MANLRINGATPANILLGSGLSVSPHDVFGNTTLSLNLNAVGGPFLTPAAQSLSFQQGVQAQANIGIVASEQEAASTAYQPSWQLSNDGSTCQTSRTKYTVASACNGMSFTFASLAQNGSNYESPWTNTFDMKVSLELASGLILPVFFNGIRLVLVQPGSTLKSDPIGVLFNAGDVFYLRVFTNRLADTTLTYSDGSVGVLATQQNNIPQNVLTWGNLWGTGEGFVFSNSTGVNPTTIDLTDSGTVTSADNGFGLGPVSVTANVVNSTSASVAIVGDSIAWQTGDYFTSIINSGSGFIHYALTPGFGVAFLCNGSDQATNWTTNRGARFRPTQLKYCKFCVCEMGLNDIFINNYTLAQLQAVEIALWNIIASYGVRTWQTTITPKTTSTDNWLTVANQTKQSVSLDLVRTQFNDWLRSGAPMTTSFSPLPAGSTAGIVAGQVGHPLKGYFEIADLQESSRNSGLFGAPGVVAASGTATSGSATTLADTTANWTTNQWAGYMLANTTNGTFVQIVKNTATVLTVKSTTAAAAGNVYSISNTNTVDGTHPTPAAAIRMSAGINKTQLVS